MIVYSQLFRDHFFSHSRRRRKTLGPEQVCEMSFLLPVTQDPPALRLFPGDEPVLPQLQFVSFFFPNQMRITFPLWVAKRFFPTGFVILYSENSIRF